MRARLGAVLCGALALASGVIAAANGATGRIPRDFYCGAPVAVRCKGICDPLVINVVLSKRGTIKWNGDFINRKSLSSQMKKVNKEEPGGVLFVISADPATSYESFSAVIYELQSLGARHMECELPTGAHLNTPQSKLGH